MPSAGIYVRFVRDGLIGMSNGRPWSRHEIDQLFQTVTEGGNTFALSMDLSRTHEALIAKAKRLNIRFEPHRQMENS